MDRKRSFGMIVALAALTALLGLRDCEELFREPSGWGQVNGDTVYRDDSGTVVTGWQEIEGNRYCFDPDGILHTGWAELDGSRYYLGQDGVMVTGWQQVEGKRYYFDGSGIACTGPAVLEGVSYLFDDSGAMVTGWADTPEGNRYFLEDGTMASGWQQIDGKTYRFGEDGAPCTGWFREGEYDYYFLSDGSAAVGPTEIDGKTFFFTPSGIHIWLVNANYPIHEDYEVTLAKSVNGYLVSEDCVDALDQMLSDCRDAGCGPQLISGYRTYWDQHALYSRKIDQYGAASGKQIVALPDTSEHQLGLAVDIVGAGYTTLNAKQASTTAQIWLMEHCWDYGFILRYPEGTTAITGIIYEPWHYRYVGLEVAQELKTLGITLEEYLGAANPIT